MSETRDALRSLGQTSNEASLIEAGARTLRDAIRETLAAKGISSAVGFEVTLKNGENFTIVSDSNPRMDTPAVEVSNVVIKQSARAGYVSQIELRF